LALSQPFFSTSGNSPPGERIKTKLTRADKI
jgi:hypothetical protein